MQDAILSIFQTYIGLACVAPVIFLVVYRVAVRRYGGAIAHDIGRLFGPALGLFLLGLPLLMQYPFAGFLILGMWVAYVDQNWKAAYDENGNRTELGSHFGWLKSLIGRDDGPFGR
jgi:uncharacterized protein YqgC (DUF456 family)